MNKRTLLAGFIVLVVGITVSLVGNQLVVSAINAHPQGFVPANSIALWDAYWAVAIVGYLLGFAGVILLILGFVSKHPPANYNINF
jgi:uncharacterized membrane protein